MIYRKNWFLKVGTQTFLGSSLTQSIKQLLEEYQQGKVQTDTVAQVGAHGLWRLTRIGIFAMMIALMPFILLMSFRPLGLFAKLQ